MYGYNGNQMQNYSCSNGAGSGSKSERRYKSSSGATIVRDSSERITSFRYNDFDPFYHFEYGSEGSICSIDRTDGWNWRRVKSNDFNGWVIHNYWDCWKVNDEPALSRSMSPGSEPQAITLINWHCRKGNRRF